MSYGLRGSRAALVLLAVALTACGKDDGATGETATGATSSDAVSASTPGDTTTAPSATDTTTATTGSNTGSGPSVTVPGASNTSGAPTASATDSSSTDLPAASTAPTASNTGGVGGDPNTPSSGAPSSSTAPATSDSGGGNDPGSDDPGSDDPGTGAQDGGQAVPGPAGGECTRESLKANIDAYLDALLAHDPGTLPLAASVKFTENAEESPLADGPDGLWQGADGVELRRDLLDTETCGTLTHGVLTENGDLVLFGVRLKVVAGELTEVEQYVARDTEFAFKPDGVLDTADQDWEGILPEAERVPREDLIAAANAYFDMFEDIDTEVPFDMPCDRWENGTQTTSGNCKSGVPSGVTITHRRFPVIDVEAGFSVGFVLFAGNLLDFHMFKLKSGKIQLIQALVGPSASDSGWPDE